MGVLGAWAQGQRARPETRDDSEEEEEELAVRVEMEVDEMGGGFPETVEQGR